MENESHSSPFNKILVISLIAAAFIIGVLWQRLDKSTTNSPPSNQQATGQNNVAGAESEVKEYIVEGGQTLGEPNAPITIFEFSDFQCPYCAMFAQENFPEVKKSLIDTGKAKFVFINFPIHANSQKAAEASLCAVNAGKYWEYSEKLFAGQDEWAGLSDPTAKFKEYAEQLGIDSSFGTCLEVGQTKETVNKNASDATKYGISAAPMFVFGKGDKISYTKKPSKDDPNYYLGDKQVSFAGAMPLDAFTEVIDNLSK